MPFAVNQFRDLSTLFSRREVIRWSRNDFASFNQRLARHGIIERNRGISYLGILRKIYRILKTNYPNEYILKNEFLNQWLKHELGTEESIVFSEFRIGGAIADLAMFNGVSRGFEIKTILDSEYRLSRQLRQYKKIFNEVYIVVPQKQLSKYVDFDRCSGIISFDTGFKHFELIRKAERDFRIDSEVLMQVLHTHEYLDISKKYFRTLPAMNAFNQFKICKELISGIPHEELNVLYIQAMKRRKINNSFFNKINSEFNQISLSLNLDRKGRDSLVEILKSNRI